jgi:hypothetical protein
LRACQLKCLFQAIKSAKLDIAEAFRLHLQLVLDNAYAGDFAASEEVAYVALGGIEGEVAQMGSIRGLGRQRKLLALLYGKAALVAL